MLCSSCALQGRQATDAEEHWHASTSAHPNYVYVPAGTFNLQVDVHVNPGMKLAQT